MRKRGEEFLLEQGLRSSDYANLDTASVCWADLSVATKRDSCGIEMDVFEAVYEYMSMNRQIRPKTSGAPALKHTFTKVSLFLVSCEM